METNRVHDGSEDMLGRVMLPSYRRLEDIDEVEGDKGKELEMEEEGNTGYIRDVEWSLPRALRAQSYGGWRVEEKEGGIPWRALP